MGTLSANQRPVCEVTDQSQIPAITIVMRHEASHSSQYDPCFASLGSVKTVRISWVETSCARPGPDPGVIIMRVVLVLVSAAILTIHDLSNGQYSEWDPCKCSGNLASIQIYYDHDSQHIDWCVKPKTLMTLMQSSLVMINVGECFYKWLSAKCDLMSMQAGRKIPRRHDIGG